MGPDSINGLGIPATTPADRAAGAAGAGPTSDTAFGDVLLDAMREANRLQGSADQAIAGLAAGDDSNVADVMTAVEKADLAFRTLMQVRNKLVDAYEELMRLRI